MKYPATLHNVRKLRDAVWSRRGFTLRVNGDLGRAIGNTFVTRRIYL